MIVQYLVNKLNRNVVKQSKQVEVKAALVAAEELVKAADKDGGLASEKVKSLSELFDQLIMSTGSRVKLGLEYVALQKRLQQVSFAFIYKLKWRFS